MIFVFYVLSGCVQSVVYSSQYDKTFYVTWRKVVRRIWSLPYSTRCDTLPIINNSDYIELAKFIWSCLNSSNVVVKNVSLSLLGNTK